MREDKSYAADFETTTLKRDCRVWAWGIASTENPNDVICGTDLDSFMSHVHDNALGKVYFHNLAFDGKFIVDWLMRHGYKHVKEFNAENANYKAFTTLVSSKGAFYAIEWKIKPQVTVKFLDSLKLYPMSVRSLASAFGLPITKGEIDYNAYREPGHELTSEELDYLKRDVTIVATVLDIGFHQGLTRLTIGSNCMADFKWRINMEDKKRFKKLFPVLSVEDDSYLRQAYRGGFTFVNPKYAGVDVENGISVDFNSMYPSMMIMKDYPVGDPVRFFGKYKEDKKHPLYVQTLVCEFSLKPDHVPTVQLRGRGFYGEHEYVKESLGPEELTLTCIDLDLLFENYNVDVLEWRGGHKFRSKSGEEIFGEYIEYWGEIKRTSTGAMRQLAKLYLNNLYGKFSTNPDVTQKVPQYDAETDTVKWVMGEKEVQDPVYLPVGAFCTAYARDTLIRAILANYDRFVYCDTDSMHLLGTDDPYGIPLHPTNLGAWGVEGTFTHARHLRAKCYIWDLNGEISVTCAGMPDNIKKLCTFDNFHYGFSNLGENGEVIPGAGKLTPVTVPGGVVLVERAYQLKL